MKRNVSVLVIGALTVLAFLAIIFASAQKEAATLPTLIKLQGEEGISTNESATSQPTTPSTTPPRVLGPTGGVIDPNDQLENAKRDEYLDAYIYDADRIDEVFGTLEIAYTQTGFEPRNATGYRDQLVRWTNATANPITIIQTTNTYAEWENGKTIAPGSTLEFRVTDAGLWTYIEKASQNFGSIYVRVPYANYAPDDTENQ